MNNHRFPVEVKAMGLLKHGKWKICMFSVSWSDQNIVIIYRAFEELRKLHKTLKRKFPIERGLLRNSDRTIPKFPVSVILWKNQRRSKCMKSLKQLEIYCQELLKTQPHISQGEDVIRFFEAQGQDLDPSFPKNSNITFPSEMGDGIQEPPAWPSTLTISEPIISPIYTCLEPFETTDLKNSAFKALPGEPLEVVMKDRTGWWLVENDRKQLAWFPASYLEETEEGPTMEEANKEDGMLYYLTQPYEAQEADELSVKTGVLVEVLEKLDSGWWLVWYNGKHGYVPSVFLQPYRNPHYKFLALTNQRLCISSPNLLEVPALLSKTSPTGQKHDHGGEPSLWRRSQSCFLGPAATTASSSLNTETESLSDTSGSLSDHESPWPPKAKVRRVGSIFPRETPQHTSGHQGSPSPTLGKKPWSRSGLDKEPVSCSDPSCGSSLVPAHHGPPVPPRPAPHKILQKCSTITKKAVQMALPRANPPGCN